MDNNNNILEVAKSWIGTRFHFAGRIKKNDKNSGGVDCIGLIMKIGEEVNATYNGINIINYDYLTYSRYPNNGEMKKFLDGHFNKISKYDIKVGDLLYFNFANGLEHIAVVSDIGIIHCYIEARAVVEHRLNDYWNNKIIEYYRYNFSEI